jgi:NitT/TauT family transport system ATP-binding protein
MSNAAIVVARVCHAFGEPGDPRHVLALDNISLEIERGELVCLIGPSGCGKSTLLNIIGGLASQTAGRVTVAGREVKGPQPKDIAFVFQESSLFPWNTALDNIKIGLKFQRVPAEAREGRARDALAQVGMAEFADHYPDQLSGGMKQRVALARALSFGSDILLMDEPFGALDEQTRMVLGEDLSVLLGKTDKSIVFVTHSLAEAVFLADRVIVITARPGRVKEIITVDEPHPRRPDFMTSDKFNALRNRLYELLRDEIRKAAAEQQARAARGEAGGAS